MDHAKNYKLTKTFRLPTYDILDVATLDELIQANRKISDIKYFPLERAYENDYDIFHLQKKEAWKPDNRIAVNFAKYITDVMNGFFIGVPIKTECSDEKVKNYLEFVESYNNQDDKNAQLSKYMSIFGRAYEMYYIDEDGEIGTIVTKPTESFMVYDDSVLQRKKYFVRYYVDAEERLKGSFSDATVVRYFHYESGSSGKLIIEDEVKYHGFIAGVPATEYIENDERMGIYESVMSLIDEYNKALSEKANDVDSFADAYLKIIGPEVENEDIINIRSNRIISFATDSSEKTEVDFLGRPSGDEEQEHLLDRLHKLIFFTSMVADMSDDKFATSSGIAIKYKMTVMSNLFKTKERKFTAGLNQRYKLIFSNPVSGRGKDDWIKLKYTFTQNYPANISDEAETASKLKGIVSNETALSVISIIDDPKSEIEKMEKEIDPLNITTDFNLSRVTAAGEE